MAYYDKETLATEDAMRIGRLHTFLPGDKQLNAVWMCQSILSFPRHLCHPRRMQSASASMPRAVCAGSAGWKSANIAFMRGGGYSVSKDIPNIQQDTIIFWGADDEILEKGECQALCSGPPPFQVILCLSSMPHLLKALKYVVF